MHKILIIIILTLTAQLIPLTGTIQAATIVVPDNYRSIQEAVDKAAPGDSIIVNEGTYSENIVVSKPLSIRSSKGPASTIVRAGLANKPVFNILSTDKVTLSGFTATGSNDAGVILSNARNALLNNNITTRNANGIILSHSNGNTITENEANLNTRNGLYLEASTGNKIEKNIANSNSDKGIFISHSDKNEVINNNANRNQWNGIMFFSSHGNIVHDNMTFGNTFGVVMSDSSDNDIGSNTTLPNIFIILPIVLIYLGILFYIVQKNILRLFIRG